MIPVKGGGCIKSHFRSSTIATCLTHSCHNIRPQQWRCQQGQCSAATYPTTRLIFSGWKTVFLSTYAWIDFLQAESRPGLITASSRCLILTFVLFHCSFILNDSFIYSLTISHTYTMHLDYIYPHSCLYCLPPSCLLFPITLDRSPISATGMLMHVGSSH